MMTPTRKSGRQPKPSTKLKEYLYDNEVEKAKEPASRVADKKKAPPATKEPAPPRAAEKKRVPQITKQPAARVLEKRGAAPPIKKGVIERGAAPPIKKGVIERRAPPPIKKGVIERRALQIKKEPEEPPVDKRKLLPVKKEPAPRVPEKRKISQVTKEPAPRVPEKRKISQVTKEPAPRIPEKRKISQVTKESPDSLTSPRKSRRTPKPSVKLLEFVYDDEREKSVESVTNKRTPRETEKLRRTVKIKEEIEDVDDEEEEEEQEEEEEEDREEEEEEKDEDSRRSPVKKKPAREIAGKVRVKEEPRKLAGKMPNHQSGPKRGRAITSPRARVTNLTSLAAKKEKLSLGASRLTVRKGKIYTTSPVSTTRERLRQGKPGANSVVQKKTLAKRSGAVFKERIPLTNKRKREPNLPQANKRINKAKESSRLTEKVNRSVNQKKENSKENKHKVEKKEIEKVLQVNKEVMTQLLNFGAEVAEAMACNNESIFSFSTKDNPLQTFKIDKQDDFSDEEVVKIIKWFEEEEEQRRAYRKRILEALRASHETNMSLYTQMLKMLQSVTAC